MYIVTSQTDGRQVAVTETVRYIKANTHGGFTNATESDAQGVAVNSVAYNLWGKEPMDNAQDTVAVKEVDGGQLVAEQGALLDYVAMMVDVDLDIVKANTNADTDESDEQAD